MSSIRYDIWFLLHGTRAPLYRRDPNQTEPQKVYLEMDSEGVVTVGRYGSNPVETKGDGILCWPLSPYADAKSLHDFLQSEPMRSLLERVHNGHSVDRDHGEIVVRLTEDAQEASSRITSILENKPYMERKIYSRQDWVESKFSVRDVIARGDIRFYIHDIYEEMDDFEEMECAAFFAKSGLIDQEIEKLCVDYVERSMKEDDEPDEKARKLAQMLACSDFDGHEDLPEKYDRHFSNALPFNQDGHFDDGVPALQRSEPANVDGSQQE